MIRIARTVVLAMTVAAVPAWAQVLYKWVDERGVTHYGEKPPADKGAPVTLRDATGGPKGQTQGSRSADTDLQRQEREFQQRQERRDRDAADELRRQKQEKSQATSSERERLRECRSATQDLNTMQRNPTNYSYADQAQARERISRSCR